MLEASGLRYDTAFGESEDYDLWTRVLQEAEGDCVDAPLVLHRLHSQQASRRRSELQRSLAQQVSARQIAALAPDIGEREATLARSIWLGADSVPDDVSDAADVSGGALVSAASVVSGAALRSDTVPVATGAADGAVVAEPLSVGPSEHAATRAAAARTPSRR